MLRINYDVRNLDYAYQKSMNGPGISRVTRNLLLHLSNNAEIDLSLSCAGPYSVLQGVLNHVRQNTQLANKGIPLTVRDRVGIFFERQGLFFSNIQNGLLKKALYKFVMAVQAHLNPAPTLSRRLLSRSDIYHATFFPIPDLVRRNRIKKIITVYDLIPLIHPEFFSERMKQIFKKNVPLIDPDTFVICISESTKNDLLKYNKNLSTSQIKVIYPGASQNFNACADPDKIRQIKEKYGISEDFRYFLSLATLEPRKNLDRLVRCFLRFIEENGSKDHCLVLVGGEGRDFARVYEAAKQNPKLENRVIFTGFIPDEDLPPLVSGALSFFYISLYEGFGLPVLEAMQCGTPVVVSNTSSLPEVVGQAGVMVDPTDDDSIVESFSKICENVPLRLDLSKRSLERARMFGWGKCAQETVDFYKKIAND